MADDKEQNKEPQKKVVATCSISIDDIFVQLHLKASKQVSECKIQNSAIEGEGKNANFHGAGSHIIAALPLKGDEISDVTAAECLKKYVSWFNGPDVANKITKDTIWPLEDNNATDASEKNESVVFIPSFSQFLTEESEDNSSSATETNSPDTSSEKSEKYKTQHKDRKTATTDAKKEKTAKGFYITYKIAIEGKKESPLSDALKGFGAGLIKGLGIQGFSWKTGAKGKEHTIGDFLDSLDKVFGKIDPTELKTRFTKNAQAKYPQTRATDVSYYDQKTILQYLKDKLDTKQKQKVKSADYSLCYKVEANDKSKKLINTTVVADCITRSIKGLFKKFKNAVKPDDVILVNDYSESDKDDKKAEKKLEVNKNDSKSVTTDNMKLKVRGRLISEEGEEKQEKKIESTDKDKKQEKNLIDMKTKLSELASKTLGKEHFVNSFICKKDENGKLVTTDISDFNVDQTDAPDVFSAIDGKKVQYAFVIQTKHIEKKETSEEASMGKNADNNQTKSVNASLQMSVDALMKKLFEANDKKKKVDDERTMLNELEEKVTNALKVLFDTFKGLLGKDSKLQDPKVYNIKVKEATKDKEQVNSSLERDYTFVNKLFESDGFNEEIKLLLEAKRSDFDKNAYEPMIKMIEQHFDQIKEKKDEILDAAFTDKSTNQRFAWADKTKEKNSKNSGYVDFENAIFNSDDVESTKHQLHSICHRTQPPFKRPIVERFLKALNSTKFDEKKQSVKVNFYDADPETGEKKGDPLNKEPFEVEKGEKLKSVDDINTAVAEYNTKLEKNAADGYKYNGWKPNINDATADEDPTEVVADYKKEQEKDKTFIVQFNYAPDQEKPNATEVIKVDGEEQQDVKAGEAAKMPEEMPEIEGYKFKDWGDNTEKLKNVEEDIIAVAVYEKVEEEKQPTEEKSDVIQYYWICPDVNGFLTPKDISAKQNHTDVDFYIVPMKGLKFDNTDDDDSNEVAGKGKQ